MKKGLLFLIIAVLPFFACNKRLYKSLQELKNMPALDYSYVVQPIFKESQQLLQDKIKNLFNADEVRIGAVGYHRYDAATKKQIDEVYRLQAVVLNSKSIKDFQDDIKMNELGREIAEFIFKNILNRDEYDKIEVSFIQQEENSQYLRRLNTFFKLPDFGPAKMFDK